MPFTVQLPQDCITALKDYQRGSLHPQTCNRVETAIRMYMGYGNERTYEEAAHLAFREHAVDGAVHRPNLEPWTVTTLLDYLHRVEDPDAREITFEGPQGADSVSGAYVNERGEVSLCGWDDRENAKRSAVRRALLPPHSERKAGEGYSVRTEYRPDMGSGDEHTVLKLYLGDELKGQIHVYANEEAAGKRAAVHAFKITSRARYEVVRKMIDDAYEVRKR